jgi:hypothetical protein
VTDLQLREVKLNVLSMSSDWLNLSPVEKCVSVCGGLWIGWLKSSPVERWMSGWKFIDWLIK